MTHTALSPVSQASAVRTAATSEIASTQSLPDWVDLRHLHALTREQRYE